MSTVTPATWDDNKPKLTLVLTLQTDLREDDEDNGVRAFWANGGNFTAAEGKGTSRQTALVEAAKKAGVKEIGLPGQHWLIRHTGMGTSVSPGPPKAPSLLWLRPGTSRKVPARTRCARARSRFRVFRRRRWRRNRQPKTSIRE